MRHAPFLILILSLFATCAFAQAELNWWVFDHGGGMVSPSETDTLYASIGQTAIGPGCGGGMCLCAGYLYVFGKTCTEVLEVGKRPYNFGIKSAYPNPFNSTCAIEFEVGTVEKVRFEIYDILGKCVDIPINGEYMQPGLYRVTWNGSKFPTGTYFARLTAGENSVTKKIVYLK